jgi:hypothetical protein
VGGTFSIDHPNPSKINKRLIHSFVEAPTPDNIYRYKIKTNNCQASLELPDYYKFLNKNDQISISSNNNFAIGYGIMNETQTCVNFITNLDGEFDVFIIGTRKDRQQMNMGGLNVKIKNKPSDIIN